MSFEKYGWAIHKRFILIDQSRHFLTPARIQEMLNLTSEYFSFFENKPPAI